MKLSQLQSLIGRIVRLFIINKSRDTGPASTFVNRQGDVSPLHIVKDGDLRIEYTDPARGIFLRYGSLPIGIALRVFEKEGRRFGFLEPITQSKS